MNLDAQLEGLFKRNLHVVKLDLEPMRELLAILGNPHRSFVAVHVAGTNGKGSVCAMVEAILREQGYRTGLYTSPHLVRFNERIKVSGADIDDAELLKLIQRVENAASELQARGSRDVTFFEFTTALALLYFQEQGIDIAVIETGMGGRLDATNVLVPAVSVITSIGLEHQEFLGETIEKIAGEKAGIIKPGRPVVIGPMDDAASAVISARAAELEAPIRVVGDSVNIAVSDMTLDGQTLNITSSFESYGTVHTRMNGMHQAVNTAIAVTVAECLDQDVGVTVGTDAIKAGLAQARWPARCEVVSEDPPVIIDGGHNPDAARVLSAWIRKVRGERPVGMIVGFLAKKDPESFMKAFSGIVDRVWIVPVQSERAMPVDELASRLSFVKQAETGGSLADAKARALDWARQEKGVVLVTGSLYLAGEYLASVPDSVA